LKTWWPPFVSCWSLYEVFSAAGIQPCGRLTKCEHRRFLRALDNHSELERVHFTIALRLSNLEPVEMAERAEREAIEYLMTGRAMADADD
jgi:hypothetical protein